MAAYMSALLTVMQPTHLLIILVCSLAGIVFGAIPGLSGGLGVSLLLPLTFGMEPTLGFAMLIGMWVVPLLQLPWWVSPVPRHPLPPALTHIP